MTYIAIADATAAATRIATIKGLQKGGLLAARAYDTWKTSDELVRVESETSNQYSTLPAFLSMGILNDTLCSTPDPGSTMSSVSFLH